MKGAAWTPGVQAPPAPGAGCPKRKAGAQGERWGVVPRSSLACLFTGERKRGLHRSKDAVGLSGLPCEGASGAHGQPPALLSVGGGGSRNIFSCISTQKAWYTLPDDQRVQAKYFIGEPVSVVHVCCCLSSPLQSCGVETVISRVYR